MTVRIPWPWEGKALPPADARRLLEAWRRHAFRSYPEPEGLYVPVAQAGDGGELAGVRDTAARLEREALDMTDGSPASREWARAKAATARDTYHDQVWAGREPRPTKR